MVMRRTGLFQAVFCTIALVATSARAQSAELLDAVRLNRPTALADARSELTQCGGCADRGRLALLAGYLALSSGDAAEARNLLRSAPPPPALAAYHGYYLGEALFYAHDPAGAAAQFTAALPSAAPSLAARLRARLGEAYLAAGDPEQALSWLDKALADQEQPELYAARAKARAATGDEDGAKEDWKALAVRYAGHPAAEGALEKLEAAEPDPLTFDEWLDRSRALLETSPTAALKALDAISARKLDRGGPAKAKMALVAATALYALGREADAAAKVEVARKGPPDVAADALLLRAKRLLHEDRNEEARALMAEIQRRFPRAKPADEADFYVGWIDVKEGKLERAVKSFDGFERRHARSRRRDEVLWFRALALIRMEKYADARQTLEKLARELPQSKLVPQALYWAARARQLGGEKDGVAGDYRQVIQAFPGTFYAWLSDARLREMGEAAPKPFPDPPRQLTEEVPANLQVAVELARTGLLRDASLEVERQLSGVRTADKALAYGHALQKLGEFGQAHALAVRRLWGQAFGERSAEALALFFPKAFETAVQAEAKARGITPELVWAIMRRESGFRPEVQSAANARGLMQLLPTTGAAIARELAQSAPDPDELFSPELNIRLGSWYLAALMKRFKHPTLCAAAYNAGPNVAAKWVQQFGKLPLDLFVEMIPYKETRGYVKQVVADLYNYRALYAPEQPAPPLALELPQPDESGVTF